MAKFDVIKIFRHKSVSVYSLRCNKTSYLIDSIVRVQCLYIYKYKIYVNCSLNIYDINILSLFNSFFYFEKNYVYT